jgi:hypothetical protein
MARTAGRGWGGWSGAVALWGLVLAAPAAEAGGLPLLSSQVDADRLPKPIGINLTFYHQNQDYDVEGLSFSVPGIAFDPSVLAVDNSLEEMNLKLDVWLFPFLDVFALFGQIDATTTVDFSGADLPIPLGNVVIRYDGDVYGGGITLAAGGERFFASLTGIYTETDLGSQFESDVVAYVVAPKVGITYQRNAFWIGAMYQRAQEEHLGQVAIPFYGPVDFAVELREADRWNLQVGMQAELAEHWVLELEGGAGERLSTSFGLSYRF